MFIKLSKHRTYQYTPRFYNPKKDERERRKIYFRRATIKRSKSNKLVILFIGMAFILYTFYLLSGVAK